MENEITRPAASPAATPEELALIAKLSRRPLTAEEVYVFSVTLCDNEIDRDGERFTRQALEELAPLFVGKTGIFDHSLKGRDQVARIFECHTEELPERTASTGEPYVRLRARAYLPRTARNADLITEIDAGIKKEVSIGCAMAEARCSICGADLRRGRCDHVKGRRYDKAGKPTVCCTELSGPTDAYEWSFVAVPAQPRAGVTKSWRPAEDPDFGPADGGRPRQEVLKKLQSGSRVILGEGEARRLWTYLERLEKQAAGYREELGKEAVRLMTLVCPTLPADSARRIVGQLDVGERKSLCQAYRQQLDRRYPPVPQLAGDPSAEPENYDGFVI